jgi:hypothetical protein
LYNPRPANAGRLLSLKPGRWRRLRSRSSVSVQSPTLPVQRQNLLGPTVLHSRRDEGACDQWNALRVAQIVKLYSMRYGSSPAGPQERSSKYLGSRVCMKNFTSYFRCFSFTFLPLFVYHSPRFSPLLFLLLFCIRVISLESLH